MDTKSLMKNIESGELMPLDKQRRVIEEIIPLREISQEATQEKSIRKGHISTLHLWWARRPLVSSRATVFTSLMKSPKTKDDYDEVMRFITKLCKWENSDNKTIINRARKIILECNDGKVPKILDCFAGGGSIPLESLRLGCETHTMELNPVAYLIELCTLVYPQKYGQSVNPSNENEGHKTQYNLSQDLKKWGEWILKESELELKDIFRKDLDGKKPIAYLWVRTVKCPNPKCGVEIPMIKQLWLANKKDRKIALKIILDQKNKQIKFDIVEGKKIDFDPQIGTMKLGNVKCPFCNQVATGTYIRTQASKVLSGERLIAVVKLNLDGIKEYHICSKKDTDNYKNAVKLLQRKQEANQNLLPDELISRPPESLAQSGSSLKPFYVHLQIVNYGLERWADLFNKRQTLCLVIFIEKIKEAYEKILQETKDKEYAKAITTYLALITSRHSSYNTNLCWWETTGERPFNIFGRQALPIVWDYAEQNPFGTVTGNWKSQLDGILNIVDTISKINNSATVIRGTATNIVYDEKFFDAVITDPPYYDSIPYSDLSDFFYVWLKRSIGKIYPELFVTPLTPKSNEIIQNTSLMRRIDSTKKSNLTKNREFYEREMTLAFQEVYRVLKDNGIFVVVFSHKSTSAWETIINSLLNSNFLVEASWPIHTESSGRLQAQGTAALASSIFIVCRKRISDKEEGYLEEIKKELKTKIIMKLDIFWDHGIRGADFFISAIGPAIEVFGKYKSIKRFSGEEVTVGELLDIVGQIVTDYSLRKILHDGQLKSIDDETRFYILWKWAYGSFKIPFDDARKLAQALGIESELLLSKKNILEQDGTNVILLGPKERMSSKDLGEIKGGIKAPMIDVIHRACMMWERGEKKELMDFLSDSGYEINDLLVVSQTLSDILPEGDKEKQLLQGFLANRNNASKTTQYTLGSFSDDKK